MGFLFKSLTPVSKKFKANAAAIDIRIDDNGIITELGQNLAAMEGETVKEWENAYVSPGWLDMQVHLRDPGLEYKEDIESGAAAAAFGGFTAVACMPNTQPPIHTRAEVEYVVKKQAHLPVHVYPVGCVSKDRKGESLAEIADMHKAGAVAFSDDGDPVYNSQLMRIALEYSSMYGVPVLNHEEDIALSRPGHMHEGEVSARLGLEGTPGIAEEVMIARDIMLAEVTGGHVHIMHISTAKGIQLVREGKAKGIKVTTEVCPHHFDLNDTEIETRHFDTHCKMHPPLRSEIDRLACIEGLKDGTIDCIVTDHAPHARHEKEVEFIYAPNGIIGLETAWPVSCKRMYKEAGMSLEKLVEALAYNPRTILNLETLDLEVGKAAELTFFNADKEWVLEEKHIKSKSINTPYIGSTLTGYSYGIFNKGQFVENEI
jgi:dihydroorotase